MQDSSISLSPKPGSLQAALPAGKLGLRPARASDHRTGGQALVALAMLPAEEAQRLPPRLLDAALVIRALA